MTTTDLIVYADKEIARLNLGPYGLLGTEFVVAYDGAGYGAIRLSDGQGLDVICKTTDEVDAELKVMHDWANEDGR